MKKKCHILDRKRVISVLNVTKTFFNTFQKKYGALFVPILQTFFLPQCLALPWYKVCQSGIVDALPFVNGLCAGIIFEMAD